MRSKSEQLQVFTGGFHVDLPTAAYTFCWILVLAIHSSAGLYYSFACLVYHYLPQTQASWPIQFQKLAIDIKDFPVVAVLHGVVASLHILLLIEMIVTSVMQRELLFENEYARTRTRAVLSLKKPARRRTTAANAWHHVSHLRTKFFGRHGVFGIEYKHFEEFFLVREIVQGVLQTYQANRMSHYLPRLWLNWGFVVLLVASCWSTPIIHCTLAQRNLAWARLLCLTIDSMLDFVSTVLLPAAVFVPYYQAFDPTIGDFPVVNYYTEEWLSNQVNEYQVLLVQSWSDLGSKMLFAANLLSCMGLAKSLIRRKSGTSAAIQVINVASRVVPSAVEGNMDTKLARSRPNHARRFLECAMSLAHIAFVVWGGAVIGLQLQTTLKSSFSECHVQLYPWLSSSKPSCLFLEFNCITATHPVTGAEAEVQSYIEQIDGDVLLFFTIKHCPALYMPSATQQLHRLQGLKMQNVTIVEWGDDAALTNTHNPNIMVAYFADVRVNGIPQGLLSDDFPKQLSDVEFCICNFSSLPPTLPTKWNQGMWVSLDYAQFTAIPDMLLEMNVQYLTMAANQIDTLPEGWLTHATMVEIPLNPLSVVPDIDPATVSLASLAVASTSVSVLPHWVDAAYIGAGRQFHAADTPLCKNASYVFPPGVSREDICLDGHNCKLFYGIS